MDDQELFSGGQLRREGARSASLGKTTTDIRTRIKNAAKPTNVTDGNITLQYSIDNGTTYAYTMGDSGTQNNAPGGSLARVTVTITHQSLTRFFPFLNNRNISCGCCYAPRSQLSQL